MTQPQTVAVPLITRALFLSTLLISTLLASPTALAKFGSRTERSEEVVASPGSDLATYHSDSEHYIGLFESDLGYRLDLGNTQWSHWETADQDIWYPDLAGQQGAHSAFASIPVCYAEWTPKEHALNYALLRTIGLDYPDSAYQQLSDTEIQGRTAQGWSLALPQEDGTTFHYRLHLFTHNNCAQLLAVWTSLESAVAKKLSEELLSALSFSHPARAMEAEPMAWFYNSAGLYYHHAENYTEALEGFKHAALTDSSDLAYINNAASTFNRLGQHQAGLTFMLTPGIADQDESMIHGWLGWFQFYLQDFQAAADSYKKGFALGTLSEEDLIAYVKSLIQLEQFQAAGNALREYSPAQPGVELVRARAQLASSQGDYEQALDVLDQAAHISDSRLTFERMDILAALQNYETIVELSDQLINSGDGSALVYHYRGDAQYKLERYLDAKQSFEQSLLLAPGNATVTEYLRFTDAQLGKGDSSSISTEISPVNWPDLAPPEEVTGIEDYDSYYLMHLTAYQFDPAQPLKTTRAQTIKVRDQAGVRRYSTLTAEFNPLSEKLYVNRLQVRDSEGRLVSEVDRSSLYIGNAEDYDQATFGKVVRAPVSGLAPGHSIEFVYTTERLSPDKDFQFERLFLSGSRPIGLSALYLEGNLDSLLHNQTNTSTPKRGENSLLWVTENPPVSQNEPMQVDPAEYLATVALTSRNQWQEAGQDYRERVQSLVMADTPALEPLVRQLTAGIPPGNQTARVAALADYVQSTLTYKALEFGVRGYTPNTPERILTDRFGDCKDHSVLLWRLLLAADIPADLALANLSGPVDPTLPSIDQFDHMVVYLPELQGGTFIDATNKDINLLDFTPASLGDSWTLVLGEQPDLVKVPTHSPSRISIQRELALQPGGDLWIEEEVRLSAYVASGLRSHLKDIEKRERLNWVQRFLGDGGKPVIVESLDVDHVFDPGQDLVLKLRYRITPSRLITENNALLNPAYWERYYLSSNRVHNRQTDFEIAYPLVFEADVSYRAPHLEPLNWKTVANQREKTTYGEFHSNWRVEPDRARLQFRYELSSGRFAADEYSDYQVFGTQALDVLQQPVKWGAGEPL